MEGVSNKSTPITQKQKKMKTSHTADKAILQHLNEKYRNSYSIEEDADLSFFKGLLPAFKGLTQKNKRLVQRQILEVIHSAIDGQEEEERLTAEDAASDYDHANPGPSSRVSAWLPLPPASTVSVVKQLATSTENLERDDTSSDSPRYDDSLSDKLELDTDLSHRFEQDGALLGIHEQDTDSLDRLKQDASLSKWLKQEQLDPLSDVPKRPMRPNRKRCHWCPRKFDNKYTTTCNQCGCFVCPRHSQTTVTCINCKLSFKKNDMGSEPDDLSCGHSCDTVPPGSSTNVSLLSEATASVTLPFVKMEPTSSDPQKEDIDTASSNISQQFTTRKRKRCHRCPSRHGNKYATACSHCNRIVCPRHSETDVVCFKCRG